MMTAEPSDSLAALVVLRRKLRPNLMSPIASEDTIGCRHIVSYLKDADQKTNLLKKYKSIISWNIQRSHNSKRLAKRRKVGFTQFSCNEYLKGDIPAQTSAPICGTCDLTLARPFVCLHCPYSGCWRDSHVRNHLKEARHAFCSSFH